MARYLINLQKNVLRRLVSILAFGVCSLVVSGQIDTLHRNADSLAGKYFIIPRVERDGVSMPEIKLAEVNIIAKPAKERRKDFRRYERLVNNIKKVYPYAKIVRTRLASVNEELKTIPGEKERRAYLKNVEKSVLGEFEDDVRQMTITQGRILIKLIDRETRNTSYELIKDYRGKISAAFWQGIARIFGSNLKDTYDPDGEDILIEMIINEIDAGRL